VLERYRVPEKERKKKEVTKERNKRENRNRWNGKQSSPPVIHEAKEHICMPNF
jgi:hypothetical protein